MRKSIVPLFLVTGLVLCGCAANGGDKPKAQKPVSLVSYDDEITLDNGIVRLGVAPSVGRIVTFGKVGGVNLLWRNTAEPVKKEKEKLKAGKRIWVNYGGDKLWPGSQTTWKFLHGGTWPPDPSLDGSVWKVLSHNKTSVVIESPVSIYSHVRFRREISLEPGKPVVRVRNILTQVEYTPVVVYIWSITQVVVPEYCLLDVAEKQPAPVRKWMNLSRVAVDVKLVAEEKAARYATDGKKGSKIGTFGSWIAAVYPQSILLQASHYDEKGCYQEVANVECYVKRKDKPASYWENGKPVVTADYVELEPLGTATHLQPGESIEHVVKWKLLDRPQGKGDDELVPMLERESAELLK